MGAGCSPVMWITPLRAFPFQGQSSGTAPHFTSVNCSKTIKKCKKTLNTKSKIVATFWGERLETKSSWGPSGRAPDPTQNSRTNQPLSSGREDKADLN